MRKINIPFRGMTNVPDDNFSQDGDMAVLMNMRHKGGELVQCQPPTSNPLSGTVKQAMYHSQSGYWLELIDGVLYYRNDKSGGALNITNIDSFTLMGNVVILYFGERTEYVIWRDSKGYIYLGGLPEVPRLNVEIEDVYKEITTSPHKFYKSFVTAVDNSNEDLYHKYVKKAYLDQCAHQIYKSGGYIDRAEFRVVFKLFDGSYVKHSTIYLVSKIGTTLKWNKAVAPGFWNYLWQTDSGNNYDTFTASVHGFIPRLKIDEYDFSKWKDIIASVCVFTSGSLPIRQPEEAVEEIVYGKEVRATRPYTDYLIPNRSDIKNSLLPKVFFKILELDLNGNEIARVNDTSPSNLAVQEVLANDVVLEYVAGGYSIINGRLHNYKLKELPHRGYADMAHLKPSDMGYKYKKIVSVATLNDGRKVYAEGLNSEQISPLLVYPTPDAEKIELYLLQRQALKVNGEHTYGLRYKEFSVNYAGNMSYYIDKSALGVNLKSITSNVTITDADRLEVMFWGMLPKDRADWGTDIKITATYNATDGWLYESEGTMLSFPVDCVSIGFTPKEGDTFELKWVTAYDDIKTDDFEEWDGNSEKFHDATVVYTTIVNAADKNVTDITFDIVRTGKERNDVLKCSAVDNPFYFPAEQTYKFTGDVVGLASNAEAISTGQFGQYTLYVFTKEGIWAMAVDKSGKGAYVSQSPFSREVCSGAICPVSGGIVFASERGLMAVSRGEVAELSAPLDGMGLEMLEWSKVLFEAIADKAGVSVGDIVPIRDYLKGAKLAYNYLHNEVIVSNSVRGYSYVYSIDNKEWSVINTVFDAVTNSYPELVVYDNGAKNRYTFNDEKDIAAGVLAITRPVKVDGVDFKRLRQAALRCTFDGSLNFYVLGSNDGATFTCITGKEFKGNTTRRDLVTAMSRSKQYKYIAVAVAGKMKGRISLAELLVDGSFANEKLR